MKSASLPLRADAKPLTRPQLALTGAGILLLAMLCTVPMWNALQLAKDENFKFWNGRAVPSILLVSCVGIMLSYPLAMHVFFSRSTVRDHRGVMTTAHLFVGLLGLVLLGLSFPLSAQSNRVFVDLTENCQGSERSQLLLSYSQVLHNIRALPECSNKSSVEKCKGYAEALPYTQFLKDMEESYECSGFCAQAPEEWEWTEDAKPITVPPTLFSKKNYKVPCEGVLARDMKSFAGDVSRQLYYQGAFLLSMCMTIGLTQLVSHWLKLRKKDPSGARVG